MGNIKMSMHIDAPVERVFDAFADLEKAPNRIAGITKLEVLTDGPVGVGTRFRETRIMFKKECTEEMEFTAFQPNEGYTVACASCGSLFTSTYLFMPEGDGTRVDVEMEWKPVSFMAKVMSPLGKMMSGSVKKCLQGDMEDIRRALEGDPSIPGTTSPAMAT